MANLQRYIETTRKMAAQRQIDEAIAHLHKGDLECAIILAAAAEETLPDTEEPHVWRYLKQHPSFKQVDFNETVNWLKHHIPPNIKFIFESEVAYVIARAMSKFAAVYNEGPQEWDQFLRWGDERGHWPGLPSTNLKA